MATKNNIRSIRFSDELAELIERQIGDTFTQKFENLVTKCVWELPNREKQLNDIEAQIKRERERLYRLERATEQLRQLENDLQTTQHYFKFAERRAKTIAEAVEEKMEHKIPGRPSVCGGISSTVSAQLSVVPVTKLATMMSRMKMGATNLTSTL